MSMHKIDRVVVLCEDSLHERFLKRWLENRKIKVVDADVAPKAKGSGSAYVKNRFLLFVKKAKQKANQEGLGFIVMLDGDNSGFVKQKADLASLIEGDETLKSTFENAVVALIPSWSLDTWVLAICEIDVSETIQTSESDKRGMDEKLSRAVNGFDNYRRIQPPRLPAMIDAQLELEKLGLA